MGQLQHSVGDGPAPAFFALSYPSSMRDTIAFSQIQQYLQKYGFVADDGEPQICHVEVYSHRQRADALELYVCRNSRVRWTTISICYYPE